MTRLNWDCLRLLTMFNALLGVAFAHTFLGPDYPIRVRNDNTSFWLVMIVAFDFLAWAVTAYCYRDRPHR